MKLLAVLISLAIVGCGTKTPTIVPDKPISISKEIVEPCLTLSEDISIKTFDDILAAYGDLGSKYGICANKQNTSATLLKKLGNIE